MWTIGQATVVVILVSHALLINGQTICPSGSSYCSATAAGSTVYDMNCASMGNLAQVPPVCTNDNRQIKSLTVSPVATTIANIQNSSFSGLRIEKLILSNLGIMTLEMSAFDGLEISLQTLSLDNNQLTSIPSGMFSRFTQLTYLQLHANKLMSLEMATFDGLTHLASLTLYSNQISSVADNTFSTLGNLQNLQLQDNRIKSISTQFFTGLSALTDLRLERNEIVKLTSDVFTSLPSLQHLNMTTNAFNYLPESLFFFNTQLETLDMSANSISNVEVSTFNSTRMLRELYLNDNSLTSIPDYLFGDMNNLLTLHLQNNQISSLTSNSLAGLPLTSELSLKNNQIQTLPLGIFDSLGSLITFDLSDNEITKVGKLPFSSQRNLLSLDLSNNNLTEVRSDFFQTTIQLKTLNLDRNQISLIQYTSFFGALQLQEINLSNNQLNGSSLAGVFAMSTNLATLKLDNNPLKAIDMVALGGSFDSLSKLYLNNSCLESISIRNLPMLTELYLQQNILPNLQAANLSGVPQLSVLDLGYNDIAFIEQAALSSASQLTILNLTQNSINGSQVAMLSPNLISGLTLTSVDLSWNKITDLDTFPSFNKFYLSGNPLVCDCGALPSMSSLTQFADYETSICSSNSSAMPSFVVCHLANGAECSQRTVDLNATNEFCASQNPGQVQLVPGYVSKRSCKIPPPVIMEMTIAPTNTGFEASWRMDKFVGIAGFELTWRVEGATNTTSMTLNNTQTNNVTVTLHAPGNYVVCLRVIMTPDVHNGDYKCTNVTMGGPASTSNTKPTQSLFPLILYIIIPVAGLLILIVIIIIIVVVVRRRNNNNAKDVKSNISRMENGLGRSPSNLSTKVSGFQSELAGDAVLDMDMFENNIN